MTAKNINVELRDKIIRIFVAYNTIALWNI